jgi:hypothetical protein
MGIRMGLSEIGDMTGRAMENVVHERTRRDLRRWWRWFCRMWNVRMASGRW